MPSPVQTVSNAAGGPSGANTVSVTLTVTSGNTLVAVCGVAGASSSIAFSSFSDTKGNSWSTIDSSVSSGSGGAFGRAFNCASGSTTVTATVTNNTGLPGEVAVMVREYTPADLTSFDQHAVSRTTGANPSSGASGTTTQKSETVVGWLFSTGVAATPSAGSGFGNFSLEAGATSFNICLEDQAVSSKGTQTATFTDVTSVLYVCGVAAFKTNVADTASTYRALIGVGI